MDEVSDRRPVRPPSDSTARALRLDAFGELADDGGPEPLQFDLNEGVRIVLTPTGGFGWVIGDHGP